MTRTRSIINWQKVVTPVVAEIVELKTKEEIHNSVLKFAESLTIYSETSYKKGLKILRETLRETVKSYPEELSDGHKKHSNYAGVTYTYEFERKYSAIKPHTSKEVKTFDATSTLNQAKELLNSNDWIDIGFAIALLTGRRMAEVFIKTDFQADDYNTLIIKNIAKSSTKSRYRIPCLANSDDIEEAVIKCRELKPMPAVIKAYEETEGDEEEKLKAAMNQFNSSYQKQVNERIKKLGYESFHESRHFYGSLMYRMYEKLHGEGDGLLFAQRCLIHTSKDETDGYKRIDFSSLPELPKEIFDLNKINEIIEMKADEKYVDLNLTKLTEQIGMVGANKLTQLMANNDLETALAILIKKGLMVMDRNENTEVKRVEKSDIFIRLIDACIEYNFNQKSSDTPVYIAITASFIGLLHKYILNDQAFVPSINKALTFRTPEIADCYKRLPDIEKLPRRLGQLSNLHLREKTKMKEVMEAVKFFYDEFSKM
ncbi:protelomerase family protein [Scytonema sp. PCC 10023]|uniref:protelomerase family protein n=1 Tax=Scytonema sp. PCC 10023 TaxID=1680591 RepID=UPI0039C6EBBF